MPDYGYTQAKAENLAGGSVSENVKESPKGLKAKSPTIGWSANSLAGRIIGEFGPVGIGAKVMSHPDKGMDLGAEIGNLKGFEEGGPVMNIDLGGPFGSEMESSLQTAMLGPIVATDQYATGTSYANGGLVSTNTDALLIELISVLRDKQMGVNVYTDTGEQVQSRFEQYRAEEEERADRDYGAI